MTRNLLRLAVLVSVLAATFGLTLLRPALAQLTCGSGDYFVSCSKTCCGPGVTTTYSRTGLGTSCSAARSACLSCLPACPPDQTLCDGPKSGTCGL